MSDPSFSSRCPSRLRLCLSLVENELGQAEREGLEAHLAGCDRCRALLDSLRRERDALYAARPALDLAPVRTRQIRRLVLVGACACLVLALGLGAFLVAGDREDGPHFKGETPSLIFRVERQGRVFAGRSPARLRPGDRIRFAYTIRQDAYLLIVNVDAAGRMTAYYPHAADRSMAIRAGEEVFLPGSIRLDDFVGQERIFALFSRGPLDLRAVEAAVEKLLDRKGPRPLEIETLEALPFSGHQVSILVLKEENDG